MKASRVLDVYLHGSLVGQLSQRGSGGLSFAYDAHFLSQAHTGISLCLPLQAEAFAGERVQAFFSGLLPDENIRQQLARNLGVSKKNSFALLNAIGGECAGALALYPTGDSPLAPEHVDHEVLDNKKLKQILDLIKRQPMLTGDPKIRLSLAGAQGKLAIGFDDGKVTLIKGGEPTTHILKPPIECVTDSVHNEFFCMRLAAKVGIPVPQVDIHFVDEIPCYIVARYDRVKTQTGLVQRIHQEDFCQALGILPEIKYEREGGPSIASCQQLIIAYSATPAADNIRLLKMIIFNYLIGNSDAHGKNFSWLYQQAKPELAPAYDLLSTTIYPDLTKKMAMKIGGEYDPDHVFLRHWLRLVPETKLAQVSIQRQLLQLSAKTKEQSLLLKEELNKGQFKSAIFDELCSLIDVRAEKIAQSTKLA